jgi:L-rhamnose mutarotase
VRRVCFTLQVKPDRIEEYRRRHAQVWPEMIAALRRSGWRDYSLFLREDGLLVGYLLCDDFPAALAAMDATEVNARWQAEMAEFFAEDWSGASRPDQRMHVLQEVFNVDGEGR